MYILMLGSVVNTDAEECHMIWRQLYIKTLPGFSNFYAASDLHICSPHVEESQREGGGFNGFYLDTPSCGLREFYNLVKLGCS